MFLKGELGFASHVNKNKLGNISNNLKALSFITLKHKGLVYTCLVNNFEFHVSLAFFASHADIFCWLEFCFDFYIILL